MAIQEVVHVSAQPRFSVVVLGMFAGSGLLLVALGVYGVMAYTVAQKTREMAIRLALGGQRRDVFRLVLRLGARLLAAGVAIGLVAGAATNRLLVNQLWNTSPHDVTTGGGRGDLGRAHRALGVRGARAPRHARRPDGGAAGRMITRWEGAYPLTSTAAR